MPGPHPSAGRDPLVTEAAFKGELDVISNEIYEATYIHHAMEEINELCLKDQSVFFAMNEQPHFWIAYRAAGQAALFMCLGRIFDTDDHANSIHRLVRMTRANLQIFSRASLEARKVVNGFRPSWLDGYLKDVWVPRAAEDLKLLRDALKPHAKLFEAVYRPIRHSVYGHRLMSNDQAGTDLFPQTNREAVGKILDFLHDLIESIEQLYLNGIEPVLGRRDFTDYDNRIRDDARNVMRRLSAHLVLSKSGDAM